MGNIRMKKFIKKHVTRPAVRRFRKRYIGKRSGALKVGKIAKDVMWLKSVLNPEKKLYTINTGTTTTVGQVNGATASGYFALDITPNIAQGVTSGTRNGNSIKWHSINAEFQMYDMSQATSPVHYKVVFFQPKGAVFSAATNAVSALFDTTTFVSGVIDYNSQFNPDKLGNFKILRVVKGLISPDNFSGQKIIKTFRVGLKLRNHHVRYDTDASSTPVSGQIIMAIFLDNGNCSTTAACTLSNVPNSSINTGQYLNYSVDNWYYDN